MSRLSIEISPEQHQQIKALAALQGKSIKDFILNKLLPVNEEDEDMAALKSLLLSRIKESKSNSVSSKSIQQITDEVLNS